MTLVGISACCTAAVETQLSCLFLTTTPRLSPPPHPSPRPPPTLQTAAMKTMGGDHHHPWFLKVSTHSFYCSYSPQLTQKQHQHERTVSAGMPRHHDERRGCQTAATALVKTTTAALVNRHVTCKPPPRLPRHHWERK